MHMLTDTYTWIIFSFAVFLLLAVKFGWPAILAALDSKIKTIRDEVAAAETLRAEANALLLEFEQRQRDAAREADTLVAQARASADQFRQHEEERLAEMMARKEEQLTARISLLRDQAVAELRQVAADLAFDATEKLMTRKLDADTRARLIDRALDQVRGYTAG